MLFFDHAAESAAPSWNHLKLRNYHRRHIMTCFRGPPARPQRTGPIVVYARGGDEAILRHVANLPFVSLRVACSSCKYDIPGADLIPVLDNESEIEQAWSMKGVDVYLVARSGP